jgi:DNA repair exonuclease SbcCD ATPase subunit
VDRCLRVGVFAVKAVVRAVEDKEIQEEVFQHLDERAAAEARPVAERTARNVAEKIALEHGQRKTRPVFAEADRLRQQLDEKDERIRKLRELVAQLKTQLKELREQLSGGQTEGAARTQKKAKKEKKETEQVAPPGATSQPDNPRSQPSA